MTLSDWLNQATRKLSRESAEQVRREIQEHYDSERDTALACGSTSEQADRQALAALGDPRSANFEYRRVLLTAAEAKILRGGNWEAKAFCAHGTLRRALTAIPALALIAAIACFATGRIELAKIAAAAVVTTGLLFAAPLLPVYTAPRARIFRIVKWAAIAGAFALIMGADAMKMSWLIFSSLWPIAWIEWTRTSIRRKLPVARWPKQLYL